MFKIEKKEYDWVGNYWQPRKEIYVWQDAGLPAIENEKEACRIAENLNKNPFVLGFRVVNEKNKEVIKKFEKQLKNT